MVKGLKESNWDKVRSLHIILRIDDGVTKSEGDILNRRESKHIRRHEFIVRAIHFGCSAGSVILQVELGAIEHVAHEPSVKIVKLEPLTRCKLDREHRHGRIAPGQDIRRVIGIAELYILSLQADRAEPCVEGDTAFTIGEVTAVVCLFVLHTGLRIQKARLRQFGAVYLCVVVGIVLVAQTDFAVVAHVA